MGNTTHKEKDSSSFLQALKQHGKNASTDLSMNIDQNPNRVTPEEENEE